MIYRVLPILILALFISTKAQASISLPEMWIEFDSFHADQDKMSKVLVETDIRQVSAKLTKLDGKIKLTVLSPTRAQKLFDTFKANDKIPFRYTEDGCFARAHRMARMAGMRFIKVGKVFISGHLDPFPDDDWAWRYHVAPVVAVSQNENIQLMVMDPSMFDHPVSVVEWTKASLGSSNFAFQISFRNRFAYSLDDMMDQTNHNYRISDLIETGALMKKIRRKLAGK
ncbi:MAG: hypothetical protein A2X86_09315 [Bdellovibrionales bacterium GWA2_49_15]|nr:MAG: hypothetical protein A2X86_09315 [Bdellovibrionales bacterium GWA2_49_15]HAZ12977.1 hypothetical protein [Bdellovibrionales bacterium]